MAPRRTTVSCLSQYMASSAQNAEGRSNTRTGISLRCITKTATTTITHPTARTGRISASIATTTSTHGGCWAIIWDIRMKNSAGLAAAFAAAPSRRYQFPCLRVFCYGTAGDREAPRSRSRRCPQTLLRAGKERPEVYCSNFSNFSRISSEGHSNSPAIFSTISPFLSIR